MNDVESSSRNNQFLKILKQNLKDFFQQWLTVNIDVDDSIITKYKCCIIKLLFQKETSVFKHEFFTCFTNLMNKCVPVSLNMLSNETKGKTEMVIPKLKTRKIKSIQKKRSSIQGILFLYIWQQFCNVSFLINLKLDLIQEIN